MSTNFDKEPMTVLEKRGNSIEAMRCDGWSNMKLRWGICGTGLISNDFCSSAKTLPEEEHEFVAVGDRSLECAKTFATTFGISKYYGSCEEIAKDPDVDIVYIGVINPGHVPLSKLMLHSGKNVLCEKPMAFNAQQAREVYMLAREKKLFFMEAVWSRCFPIYEKIREEVQSGRLGEIRLVTAKFYAPIMHVDRIKDPALGGGCLMDIGVYTVQFANWIFNEAPEKITADASITQEGMDSDCCIILTYKSGARAVLMFGGTTCWMKNPATVHGTKANIEIPDRFWCPSEAFLPSGRITNDIPQGPVPYNFPNGGGMRYEVDLVRRCLIEGKLEPPIMKLEDSEMMYNITDEVRRQIGVRYQFE